ncbi:MAG: DUF2203 family protein [Candidatus Dormibacteria bacterium]
MKLRTYTVEEANRALEGVRELVQAIADGVRSLPDLREQLGMAEFEAGRPSAGVQAEAALARAHGAVDRAEAGIAEAALGLSEMGIALKDPLQGLVDFMSMREGEVVELCWRLGEAEVAFWHPVGAGFAGRQPL